MKNTLKGCIAVALTFGLQTVCFADESVSQTTTSTSGPPVVLDSYMKPTVVQTKETTDSAGNVQKSVAPIIQERHEHVMLPASETTTTTTERSGGATSVKTEASAATSKSTTCSAAPRRISHQVRHHYRACAKPRPVAMASQRVMVQKKVVEPATVTQRTDSTVSQSSVIERKDPALDNE